MNYELGQCLSGSAQPHPQDQEELAINAYRRSLQVRSPKDTPIEWADSQCGLATLYLERRRGARAENLEQALSAYTAALDGLPKEEYPWGYARVCRLLAEVYVERQQGRPRVNAERALALLADALQVLDRDTDSEEWAATQLAMGRAYLKCLDWNFDESLEKASDAAEHALDVFAEEEDGLQRARTVRLISALSAHIEESGPPEGDSMSSVNLLQEALPVLAEHAKPGELASALNQLATTYLERSYGNRIGCSRSQINAESG